MAEVPPGSSVECDRTTDSKKGIGCSVEQVDKAESDVKLIRLIGGSLFRDRVVPNIIPPNTERLVVASIAALLTATETAAGLS